MSAPSAHHARKRWEGPLLWIGLAAIAIGALWSWQAPMIVSAIQEWWSPPPVVAPPTAAERQRRAVAKRKAKVKAQYLRELAAIRSSSGGQSSYHYWFQLEQVEGANEHPLKDALWQPSARDWNLASTYTAVLREAVAKNARAIDLFERGVEANCSDRPTSYGLDEPSVPFRELRAVWRLAMARDLLTGAPRNENPYISSALRSLMAARVLRGGEGRVIEGWLAVELEREVAEAILGVSSRGELSAEDAARLGRALVDSYEARTPMEKVVQRESRFLSDIFRANLVAFWADNPGPVQKRDYYAVSGASHLALTDAEVEERISTASFDLTRESEKKLLAEFAQFSASERRRKQNEWKRRAAETGASATPTFRFAGPTPFAKTTLADDMAESRLRMAIAMLAIQATSTPGEPPVSASDAAKSLGIDEKWVVNPYTEKPYELRVVGENRGEIRLEGLKELLDEEQRIDPSKDNSMPDDWWAFEFPLCPDLARGED